MPELEDLLAAEAARYDVLQPPVAEIRRRRQRRVQARGGAALVVCAGVAGAFLFLPGTGPAPDAIVAGPSPVRAGDGPRIEGLRTESDERGLVATYLGGACDGPASLLIEESGDRVDVAVQVLPGPGGDEGTTCPAVGIGRSVRADLAEPLADRTVSADGEQIKPYDGANLVVPDRLPDGFALRSETGSREATGWTQTYGPPRDERLGAPCRPGQRSLSVSTGPRVNDFSAAYFRDDGPVDAGDGDARLYSQGGGSVRYVALRVSGQPVSLSYAADCGGAAPSVEELVEIADGLQPVRP